MSKSVVGGLEASELGPRRSQCAGLLVVTRTGPGSMHIPLAVQGLADLTEQ